MLKQKPKTAHILATALGKWCSSRTGRDIEEDTQDRPFRCGQRGQRTTEPKTAKEMDKLLLLVMTVFLCLSGTLQDKGKLNCEKLAFQVAVKVKQDFKKTK